MRGVAGGGVLVVAVAAVVACGDSYDEQPPAVVSDAGVDGATNDASSEVEAGPTPASCDVGAPFGEPAAVPGLESEASSATFTPDELTVYFDTSNDLFVATRPSLDAPFGARSPLIDLNTVEQDVTPAVSADGLTMVFAFAEAGSYFPTLRVATRPSPDSLFETPVRLEILPNATSLHPAFTSASLFFVGHRIGDRPRAYRSERNGGLFSVGTAVAGLETDYRINGVVVTGDELIAYQSLEPGKDEALAPAIHVARRAGVDQPFSGLAPLTDFASLRGDSVSAVSSDGCRLYFTRRLPEGGEGVFVAKKPASR